MCLDTWVAMMSAFEVHDRGIHFPREGKLGLVYVQKNDTSGKSK